MKRFIAVLLSFLFLLSGCKKTPEPNLTVPWDDITTQTTQVEDITTEPEIEKELLAVSVPAVTERINHENGTELFSFTSQHMQLILPNAVAADKIVLNFLNRVDEARTDAESIISAAKYDYSDDEEWNPYYAQLVFSPTRIDHGVLSLFGIQNSYSGGSHGIQSYTAVNYDLMTGDILTLGSIMHADATTEDFIRLINTKLEGYVDEYNLFNNYQQGVQYRLGGDENLYEDFFFTATGLNFFFSPYEIAPYSAGCITIEIPYNELPGLIYDGYFPEERELIQGQMLASAFDVANTGNFDNMAEVNLAIGESSFVVYPEGCVENVRMYISGDNMTIPEYTVFAAFEMSDKDAVVINLEKDMVDKIRVSYTSGNTENTIHLS